MLIPKVTGLSPKEAPPGTKITIRGENLGLSQADIISLTVCGVECLMYAEWKSASKIVSRCGAVTPGMRGEVIVTTKSGGKGSCTVQFKVSLESIGPLNESAVWVDESHLFGRRRQTSPSQLQPEDPLGLSDEANVGRFPEEELHDLFPDGSGSIVNEAFVPTWYLLENHHKTSFDDLKSGLKFLKRKVTQHREEPLSFLKSNAGAIVECMDALVSVHSAMEKDKQAMNSDLTDRVENEVLKTKMEADVLFEEMLTRKEKADSTRNALSVLQRFRFLFNLPGNIEKNILKGDYDVVINDYARAKSLFQGTQVEVFKTVYQEVETRIETFRQTLLDTLRKQQPITLEEQKRLIKYLVNLEAPCDPAWECVLHNKQWLHNSLNACNVKYREKAAGEGSDLDTSHSDCPFVVQFLIELTEFFAEHFPNFWKLGQSYLTGQLHIREAVDNSVVESIPRSNQFTNMISDVTHRFCELVYLALSPQSSTHSRSFHLIQSATWPKTQESIVPWLPHCLRSVRSCYASLMTLDLFEQPLKLVQQLIFDIRVDAMKTLFKQAAEDITHFDEREDWMVDIDDQNGGITQLPAVFENRVLETLHLVREAILQPGPKETELFSQLNVQGSFKQAAQELMQAFAIALDKMGTKCASDNERLKDQSVFGIDDTIEPNQDVKCLIVLTNCNYTIKSVIPRLQECFAKHGYPDMTLVIKSCQARFREVDAKIFEAYIERKSGPVVGLIEQRMYAGCFSWESCYRPTGVSVYIKETLMDMIEIHAEVFAISPPLVSRVLTRVVESVIEELARLYECVDKFEGNGNIQATINLRALEDAMPAYKTNVTSKCFAVCRSKLLPFTNPKDTELVNEVLKSFKRQIWHLLLCFKEASYVTV